MVRVNTSGNIGGQVFPGNTGGMTVNNPVSVKVNFAQNTGVSTKDTGEIHYLPQPNNSFPPKKLAKSLRLKASPRGLQRSSWDTGRSH
ncbi:hypothetical protein ES703_86107 [subsurface metagenome]